jgi:nicotinamidase-related amidase
MNDVLLVVDVVNTFDHEDGETLLASFRARLPAMVDTLKEAREDELLPIVYANDAFGDWRGDRLGFVQKGNRHRRRSRRCRCAETESPRGVSFQTTLFGLHRTPLGPMLEELAIERVILICAATEGCVVQTAIDAREIDLKATIVSSSCATASSALEQVALAYAAEVGGVRLASTLGDARSDR